MEPVYVRGDFNGVFGDLLCLSHTDACLSANGSEIAMQPGMELTAYDDDWDEALGDCYLVATGIVEPSPDWLACKGSKWSLRIDGRGLRREAQLGVVRH